MINCQLVSNKMRMVKIIPGVLAPSTVQQREPRGNKRGKVELIVNRDYFMEFILYTESTLLFNMVW